MNKKYLSKLLLPVVAVVLLFGCGVTEPQIELDARVLRVEQVDSLTDRVTFGAVAPDTLWWKLEWIDVNLLLDYGQAVYDVEVPITYPKTLKFLLDFTVWDKTNTIIVSYIPSEN